MKLKSLIAAAVAAMTISVIADNAAIQPNTATYQIGAGTNAAAELAKAIAAKREAWKQENPQAAEETVVLNGNFSGFSATVKPYNDKSTLTLKGRATFDGGKSGNRAFIVEGPGKTVFEGFTFKNYTNKESGAVMRTKNKVDVAFKNCRFFDNEVSSGAAVVQAEHGGCRLVFTDCAFKNNNAEDLPGGCGFNFWVASNKFNPATWKHGPIVGGGCVDFTGKNDFGPWSRGTYGVAGGRDKFEVKNFAELKSLLERLPKERASGKRAEITLSDGVYECAEELLLGGRNSDITVKAKNPGKAILVGGSALKGADFKPYKDKLLVWKAPDAVKAKLANFLEGNGDITLRQPQLVIDGRTMTVAVWPNAPKRFWCNNTNLVGIAVHERKDNNGKVVSVTTNRVCNTFSGREKTWNLGDFNDAYIFGYQGGCAYSAGSTKIFAAPDGQQGVELGMPNPCTQGHGRFSFVNIPAEVDEPGEWAYDSKRGAAILYPPEGFTKDSRCAFGWLDKPIISIRGDNVRLEGLAFEGERQECAVVSDANCGTVVLGCTFAGVYNGVRLGGFKGLVKDCDFEGVAMSGVWMNGGDAKNMEYTEHLVDNCRFRNCGNHYAGFAAGVINMSCVGGRVAHCDIENSIQHGMDILCNDNVLEYTRMLNVSREFNDSGAIYLSGTAAYGNIIRYNEIGSAPGLVHGVYLDDFASGVTVQGNIIRDIGSCAVMIGGGRDHTIENNLFMNTFCGIRLDNRGFWWPAWAHKQSFWKLCCDNLGLDKRSPFALAHPRFAKWMEKDGEKFLTGHMDNAYRNNLSVDISGYASSAAIFMEKDVPASAVTYEGNVAIRTKGLLPGMPDLIGGDCANAPTNVHSAGCGVKVFKSIGLTKVIDGTPENPIDLGFVKLPEAKYRAADYMWLMQSWSNDPVMWQLCAEGKLDFTSDPADFTLKPDAQLTKLVPNFKPIPFEKIGLYKDDWRKEIK